jgi:hypothetical protein
MTLAELRTYVRDLTGVYSTDLLPDALLNRWLQESYSELNRADTWPWITSIVSGTLAVGSTVITLANSSGKIKEVTALYPSSLLVQIPSQRALIQTVYADDGIKYDCNSSGNIVFTKAFTEQITYKVNYILDAPLLQSAGKATEIPDEYEGIIAYRTAVKVLNSQADDTNRSSFYLSEYASMLEDMKTDLIIDEDLGPIQIGGEILRIDGRTDGRVNLRFRSS